MPLTWVELDRRQDAWILECQREGSHLLSTQFGLMRLWRLAPATQHIPLQRILLQLWRSYIIGQHPSSPCGEPKP